MERYPNGWTGGPMNDNEKAYARKYLEWLGGERKSEPRHNLSDTNARMIRAEVTKIVKRERIAQ